MINAESVLATLNRHNKINYDDVLKTMMDDWHQQNSRPSILIHSCCAPCSTYVLEYLAPYADITIFFANSNIHPGAEYQYRSLVQQKFITDFNQKTGHHIAYIEAPYNPSEFIKSMDDLRDEREGGKRCHRCYEFRLDLAAEKASELGFDYFASALTLSPKKNSQKINELGLAIQHHYSAHYLPSDFKKNNGYKRSIKICKEYNVYRQCYCGCIFAAKEQGIDLKTVTENAKLAIAQFKME